MAQWLLTAGLGLLRFGYGLTPQPRPVAVEAMPTARQRYVCWRLVRGADGVCRREKVERWAARSGAAVGGAASGR